MFYNHLTKWRPINHFVSPAGNSISITIRRGDAHARADIWSSLVQTVAMMRASIWRFPHYRPFVRGIHWWHVDSLKKGQWYGVVMFLLCYSGQAVEHTVELPVVSDTVMHTLCCPMNSTVWISLSIIQNMLPVCSCWKYSSCHYSGNHVSLVWWKLLLEPMLTYCPLPKRNVYNKHTIVSCGLNNSMGTIFTVNNAEYYWVGQTFIGQTPL